MPSRRIIHTDLDFVNSHEYADLRDVLRAMTQEIENLRWALRRYGVHDNGCKSTARGCDCRLKNLTYQEDSRKHQTGQDYENNTVSIPLPQAAEQ